MSIAKKIVYTIVGVITASIVTSAITSLKAGASSIYDSSFQTTPVIELKKTGCPSLSFNTVEDFTIWYITTAGMSNPTATYQSGAVTISNQYVGSETWILLNQRTNNIFTFTWSATAVSANVSSIRTISYVLSGGNPCVVNTGGAGTGTQEISRTDGSKKIHTLMNFIYPGHTDIAGYAGPTPEVQDVYPYVEPDPPPDPPPAYSGPIIIKGLVMILGVGYVAKLLKPKFV